MPLSGRTRLDELARSAYRRLPSRVQRPIVRARHQLRERLDSSAFGRLSVVMPVYNVEAYLAEAIDSVLTQSYRNLELILVDDGSTDRSGAECDRFAQQDARVRVIHKSNAGLGAARNTGIAAAGGKYLTFIDSDDFVLPGAYEAMITSMRKSGSDVATGNVKRRQGKREYQAWNQSRSHRVDQSGVTLANNPELVFDTVAWNKVFRRRFWNKHVKAFPVDKLYEDIVPIFTAFMRARSIDVLARPVYIWRLRDEGDSITQRLLEPNNIGDRFEMIDQVDELIRDHHISEVVADRLRLKILEGDLWIYVREMTSAASEQTVDTIQRIVQRYWPKASAHAIARIPADRRVCYWLLERDRAADVPLFRQWFETIRAAPPLRYTDGRILLDVSACSVALDGIPADIVDMASAAESIANLTAVRWTGPTTLAISGYAYTKYVSTGDQIIELIATSIDPGAHHSVALPVRRTASPDAARWAADIASSHDRDGFVCEIDAKALRASAMSSSSQWSFAVRVTDGEVVRTTELQKIWRGGSAAVVGSAVVGDNELAIVKTDKGQPLRLLFDSTGVPTTGFDLTGARATLTLADTSGVSRVTMVRDGGADIIDARRDAGQSFSVDVPTAPDPDQVVTWRFYALMDGKRVPLLAPAGFRSGSTPNPDGLRAVVNRTGRAIVQAHRETAFVDAIECTPAGDIQLSGSLFALDTVEIGIAPGIGIPDMWHAAEVRDGRFRVLLPPSRADFAGVQRVLRSGTYQICARRPLAGSVQGRLLVSDAMADDLPATHLTDRAKLKFERRAWGRLGVEVSAPIPTELMGRYARDQVIERSAQSPRELEDAIFFCVDLGGGAADSGLAIYQELRRRGTSLRSYWGVEDYSVPVPDGGIAVIKGSATWFEKVNRCRYIVNNYGAIWGLSKDPGQRYLQTWHGTPLKHIGISEARHRNAANSRLEEIAHESAAWDVFTSPSPYFTALISPEFLFTGEVLEAGYPRNDRLATATQDDYARLRKVFGIPEHARVLMYAPTYRESQRHGWRAELFDGLDLARLLSLLGSDWYVLLRGHSFNARDNHSDRSDDRVIDVTHHHDINDLYIASDVLLTDYSSVMFDYSVTRKPMAFFTPDLKRYIAARGMYFDLAEHAPGPLYEQVEHLASALRDLDALTSDYADKYEAFRQRFAPWDDGKAAARVVDAFFSE